MDIIFSKSITNIRVSPKSINWDTVINFIENYPKINFIR